MLELKVVDVINREFGSPEELREFLKGEVEEWEWVSSFNARTYQQVRSEIYDYWKQYHIDCRNFLNAKRTIDAFEELVSTIRKRISEDSLVPHDCVAAIAMRQVWEDSIESDRQMVTWVTWRVFAPSNVREQITYQELPIAFKSLREKYGLTPFESQHLQELELTKLRAEKIASEIAVRNRGLRELYESSRESLGTLNSEAARRFSELVTQFESKTEDIKKAYAEGLRLQAPVTYWKNKANEHAIEKRIHLSRMTWCAVVFLVALLLELVVVLIPQIAWDVPTLQWLVRYFVAEGQSMAPSPNSYLPTMSMLLVTISIFLLIFRPFWKMYLSAAHLEAVCKEKATMVEVYLSLIADNASMAAEDRALVLNSIFSMSSTGLVGGSDTPPIPYEALLRAVVPK